MKSPFPIFLIGSLVTAAPALVPAQQVDHQWHQWRGPEASGFSRTATPPVEWSEARNIQWKVPVAGRGDSVPIVWGDKVFLLATIDTGKVDPSLPRPEDQPKRVFGITNPNTTHQFVVFCFDRRTGREIWRRTATERVPHEGHHRDNSFASASPTTDGRRLYCWFGSAGLFTCDLDGRLLWQRDLGEVRMGAVLGEGTSPVLHDGHLIIVRDHQGQSSMEVLDAGTGKTAWKKDRDEGNTWATPLVVEHDGLPQVITSGSKRIRSHHFRTGELLWECGGLTGNPIPCPVQAEGVVYCMTGYQGHALLAIPLSARGDVTGSGTIRWSLDRGTPYVPSPLLAAGLLWFNQSNQNLWSCVDAKTGEVRLDRQRLPGVANVYASPVGADGRIYITSREGTTLVVKQSPEFEVLATNKLNDEFHASAALAGKQLFLRGRKFLYCIASE